MISEKKNIHIIISHPKGNGTFNYRIKAFQHLLELNNYTVKIPYILYPFETYFQGISKESNLLDNSSLIEIRPKINIIQKIVSNSKGLRFSSVLMKIMYALNISFYKIDLWYIPLYKSYKINTDECNFIISSGGPGSVFKMGCEIAIKSKAKLILDYRDPWNFGYNLLETNNMIHSFKRKFTLKTEIKILDYAHHITTVSESLKNFFPKKYHHKITVIENGSNFEQKDIVRQINPTPEKFSINYLGTIYNDQLFEDVFFEAFSDFYRNIENKHQISLNFIGADKNENLKKMIKKYNLEGITNITKRVNKEELMPYLTDASIFLQLRFKGRSEIITSKITDYLMFRKPILLPVTDEGDIAEAIRKYNAGYVCNGVKETLNALYSEYTKFLNKKDCRINIDKDLSQISRTEVSKKLIDIINNLEN